MHAAIDPSLLFVCDEEWKNREVRDLFLANLIDTLEVLDSVNASVLWLDELEVKLWSEPRLAPWHQETDWSNPIVLAISDLFSRLRDNRAIRLNTKASVIPDFSEKVRPDIYDEFCLLCHSVISLKELDPVLVLGEKNKIDGAYELECGGCHESFEPQLVRSSIDIYALVSIERYWTDGRVSGDLEKGMDIERIRVGGLPYKYKYSFRSSFLKDLAKLDEDFDRASVVNSVVRRLVRTQAEAYRDKSLKDEPVWGKSERRFRVTKSRRIHYEYKGENHIEFLRYYSDGEHDEGL